MKWLLEYHREAVRVYQTARNCSLVAPDTLNELAKACDAPGHKKAGKEQKTSLDDANTLLEKAEGSVNKAKKAKADIFST